MRDVVPERELLRPRTQGRWSVKDVLAHIAAWEEEADLLRQARAAEPGGAEDWDRALAVNNAARVLGNGVLADLHEFQLTSRGTALLMAYPTPLFTRPRFSNDPRPLMPISSPCMLNSGPPELPGLMDVSNWMQSVYSSVPFPSGGW